MPQEPKRRHSKMRKRTRRASISLEPSRLLTCKNCRAEILSHIICKSCGFYDGKSVKGAKTAVKVTKA